MTCKSDDKGKSKLSAWIAPTVVSVIVFSILFLAYTVNPIASIVLAFAIVIAGCILLKSL